VEIVDRERLEAIVLLLETMYDYIPRARGVDTGALPGPAASRRVRDETTGEWRTRRHGEPAWDEYLDMPMAEAMTPTTITGSRDVASEIRRLTSSIERIQLILDAHEGRYENERHGWEREREALEKAGSYAQLRTALLELERDKPELRAALAITFDPQREGLPRKYGPELIALRHRALLELSERLPVRLRVPPWIQEYQSSRRLDTVEGLAAKGLGAGAIARRLRIPKKTVQRILRRAVRST